MNTYFLIDELHHGTPLNLLSLRGFEFELQIKSSEAFKQELFFWAEGDIYTTVWAACSGFLRGDEM